MQAYVIQKYLCHYQPHPFHHVLPFHSNGKNTLLLPLLFFFFNDTATTEIYTLSLHDAHPISHAALDVHLMVQPVDALIDAFAAAGADLISFHPEASPHVDRTLRLIKAAGCRAGLAFNPATPLEVLEYVLDEIDLVLIMSVNPGFGGQSFIDSALKKVERARKLIDAAGRDIRLEVDGGIKTQNIQRVAAAGADTFVAGSAIFACADYKAVIDALRCELRRQSPASKVA